MFGNGIQLKVKTFSDCVIIAGTAIALFWSEKFLIRYNVVLPLLLVPEIYPKRVLNPLVLVQTHISWGRASTPTPVQ